MSNFAGVTFANQHLAPEDDAIIRRAIYPDGYLTGCAFSYSGTELTMGDGYLMICGRMIRHTAPTSWEIAQQTSGFARLLLTIDLSRTATDTAFDQVVASIEYAAAIDAFPPLVQEDVNVSGQRYQVAACVVSLGAGGITGIVLQLDKTGSL